MEHILIVVHVVIAAALIGAVLIQRSETDGFGLGGGSGSSFMTGRATASLLTRTTAILAALFIANSLLLSILAAHGHKPSIVEQIAAQEGDAPAVPVAVEKDAKTDTVAPAIKRDAVVDTNKAAKKAVAKKSKSAPEAPAVEIDHNAPAVPTAE